MKFLLAVATGSMLLACTTPYQKDGLAGGFSETQLAENIWRVNFQGNGYTREEQVADFALLRSAELALEHGFTHFALIDAQAKTHIGAFTTPSTYQTTSSAYVSGNAVYGQATTHQYGGQVIPFAIPAATNTVLMFKGKPDAAGTVYDARFICNSIGAKYKVSCRSTK